MRFETLFVSPLVGKKSLSRLGYFCASGAQELRGIFAGFTCVKTHRFLVRGNLGEQRRTSSVPLLRVGAYLSTSCDFALDFMHRSTGTCIMSIGEAKVEPHVV